jgi:hypothetical protein
VLPGGPVLVQRPPSRQHLQQHDAEAVHVALRRQMPCVFIPSKQRFRKDSNLILLDTLSNPVAVVVDSIGIKIGKSF